MSRVLTTVGLLSLAACTHTAEPPPPAGTDYYPLTVGAERIYAVQDTVITNNRTVSALSSQVREQLTETYRDAAGAPTYKLVRSSRATAADVWHVDSVQTLTRQAQALLLTRSNRRTVELVFPVRSGAEWDKHAFSQLGAVGSFALPNSRYEAVDEARRVGGSSYEHTITTYSFDGVEGDVNHQRELRQVYAQGVGPVLRVARQLDYCEPNHGCPVGVGYVTSGRIHRETLLP
ncbi:hypothetical protein LJ737_17690 [Hymenobacter sp. 15J16-1T3B]|nr:hypothetical protein [Hymenobacter sp. 15J16-1T3B]